MPNLSWWPILASLSSAVHMLAGVRVKALPDQVTLDSICPRVDTKINVRHPENDVTEGR